MTDVNFWDDLSLGGWIDPEMVLEDEDDAKRVREAIKVLEEYRDVIKSITRFS